MRKELNSSFQTKGLHQARHTINKHYFELQHHYTALLPTITPGRGWTLCSWPCLQLSKFHGTIFWAIPSVL